MSHPRPMIPGSTYLVTRRTTSRQHLLRPDPMVKQIYEYCLAVAAERYAITVHGWTAMGNHHHIVVRDDHGTLPAFLRDMHKLQAKALNAYWKRSENLWSTQQASVVHLADAEARLSKLVYTLANPVLSDLVERAEDYPGASSLDLHGETMSRDVQRPAIYFRASGTMPAHATLRVERPRGFEHLSDDAWRGTLMAALRSAEAEARESRKLRNRTVLGAAQILKVRHTDRPRNGSPRKLSPAFACKDRELRCDLIAKRIHFRLAYREARERWVTGDRGVVFPPGTYQLYEQCGVLREETLLHAA